MDGDVDDDTGRSILIPPAVTVRFANGDTETTACYSERHHWDEWVFATDDIRKVVP